jgi:hypothetical protein
MKLRKGDKLMAKWKWKMLNIRLNHDNANVVQHLSRMSGETASAVIRVLLAVGR